MKRMLCIAVGLVALAFSGCCCGSGLCGGGCGNSCGAGYSPCQTSYAAPLGGQSCGCGY
jgi:hypothetical protein